MGTTTNSPSDIFLKLVIRDDDTTTTHLFARLSSTTVLQLHATMMAYHKTIIADNDTTTTPPPPPPPHRSNVPLSKPNRNDWTISSNFSSTSSTSTPIDFLPLEITFSNGTRIYTSYNGGKIFEDGTCTQYEHGRRPHLWLLVLSIYKETKQIKKYSMRIVFGVRRKKRRKTNRNRPMREPVWMSLPLNHVSCSVERNILLPSIRGLLCVFIYSFFLLLLLSLSPKRLLCLLCQAVVKFRLLFHSFLDTLIIFLLFLFFFGFSYCLSPFSSPFQQIPLNFRDHWCSMLSPTRTGTVWQQQQR